MIAFSETLRIGKRIALRLSVILCGLAWAGCGITGYRLGTSLPSDIRSVHVPAFENQTREPQLEAEATQALIREIQRDGTLRIASADTADAVLSVALVNVAEEVLRYARDNADTADEYRLRLEATMTLTRRLTGEEVASNPSVQGRATFEFTGDMASSRQGAIPEASRDLARALVSAIVEHW